MTSMGSSDSKSGSGIGSTVSSIASGVGGFASGASSFISTGISYWKGQEPLPKKSTMQGFGSESF